MKLSVLLLLIISTTSNVQSNDLFIHNDFNLAKAEARKSYRRIFIEFYATWCGPCKKLDREVFASEEFLAFGKSFVFLKINGETTEGKLLVQKFKLVGYPYAIITDSNGEELDRIRSYHPKDDYLRELTRIESGQYISVLSKQFQAQPSIQTGYTLSKYFLKEDYDRSLNYYNAIINLDGAKANPLIIRLTAEVYRTSLRVEKHGDLKLYHDEVLAHPDSEAHALLMIALADYYIGKNNAQAAKNVFNSFYDRTTAFKNDPDVLQYKKKLEQLH